MKKHKVNIQKISNDVLEQLQRGAFFTVKTENKINTMTIGWGQVGIMWGMPVFVAPIRISRYTHELLKETSVFTVSVPRKSEMTKELAFCGTKSGRDVDKIKILKLALDDSESVDTPIILPCKYHFECEIVSRIMLSDANFTPEFKDRFYKHDDFHELIFGKVLECYITD